MEIAIGMVIGAFLMIIFAPLLFGLFLFGFKGQ